MIFEKHANLKYKYGNRHFWCRGYYVDTVGKNTAAIKAYIQKQLNPDFIRMDIEFTSIYKEILYASDGMLKYWYRTGNYDVTAFEQEYLEMINHWETVYGKGTENDGKQL